MLLVKWILNTWNKQNKKVGIKLECFIKFIELKKYRSPIKYTFCRFSNISGLLDPKKMHELMKKYNL